MKITRNQIYCIIPFYLDGPAAPQGPLWTADTPVLDRTAMYDFLDVSSTAMDVYRIDFERNADLRKFWQRESRCGDGCRMRLTNQNPRSWRTPRLVMSRRSDAGMLCIPVEIAGECGIDDVADFVNRFHKYDSTQAPVMEYVTTGRDTPLLDRLDSALGLARPGRPHSWTLGGVVDMLLSPLGPGLHPFEPYRAHMLTYVLGEGCADGPDEALKTAMLRLIHCHNKRYSPLPEAFDRGAVMQTFRNVYLGAADEGACMLGILKGDDSDGYMRSYHDTTFQSRMMWIYLLALMQRHVLLDVDRRIAASVPPSQTPSRQAADDFRRRVADTCSSRLTGFFTSISAYSHINDIYRFLTDRLGVAALYRELDEKLRAIDTWIKLNDAVGRERFERFVQVGGVILAVLALLYGIPQAITAAEQAYEQSMWGWTLVCVIPAIVAMAWLIYQLIKSRR